MNFIKKRVMKVVQGWARKEQKVNTKKQMSEKDEEKMKLYQSLTALFQFVRWIEKYGFRNRKERKNFWRSVMANTEVMEDTVLYQASRYAKKDEKEYIAPAKDKKGKK